MVSFASALTPYSKTESKDRRSGRTDRASHTYLSANPAKAVAARRKAGATGSALEQNRGGNKSVNNGPAPSGRKKWPADPAKARKSKRPERLANGSLEGQAPVLWQTLSVDGEVVPTDRQPGLMHDDEHLDLPKNGKDFGDFLQSPDMTSPEDLADEAIPPDHDIPRG